ncbi:unnamed protein product, partial [Rotaria magnacalcarata]
QVSYKTVIVCSRFQVLDLLNLSKCNFRDLRDVDSTTLPTMTFIQACKAYVSAGLITPTEACNCNGKNKTDIQKRKSSDQPDDVYQPYSITTKSQYATTKTSTRTGSTINMNKPWIEQEFKTDIVLMK